MAQPSDASHSPSLDVWTMSGHAAIDRLIVESNVDRPFESVENFADWVRTSYRRWALDPAIAEQLRIVDLEALHEDALSRASSRLAHARERYASCATGKSIDRLQERISKLRMECEGREKMQGAASMSGAPSDSKGQKNSERLKAAFAEIDVLTQDLESAIASCAEWKELQEAEQALLDLRRDIGIEAASTRMRELEKELGRLTNHRGFNFESQAQVVVKELIAPRFLKDAKSWWDEERTALGQTETVSSVEEQYDMQNIYVLRGVTLALAQGEFDYVIVAKSTLPSQQIDLSSNKNFGGHPQPTKSQLQEGLAQQPVLVLAVVEVKRNVNDVGPTFMGYLERIAWLSGLESEYDRTKYNTNFYPSGHFDKPFWHSDAGYNESFKFDRSSFRLFFPRSQLPCGRDELAMCVRRRLHFITRAGAIRGVSSKSESSLKRKVARDQVFARARRDFNKNAFSPGMEDLLTVSCSWVQSWWEKMHEMFRDEMSTEKLLISYRRSDETVDNIYVIGDE